MSVVKILADTRTARAAKLVLFHAKLFGKYEIVPTSQVRWMIIIACDENRPAILSRAALLWGTK